jgi:1-acyl-sn-glycerol-3-phosphate acyltransferase
MTPSASVSLDSLDLTISERVVGLCMWAPGVAWLTSMLSTLMVVQRFVPPERVDWLTRVYSYGQVRAALAQVQTSVHPEVDPNTVYMFAQNHVNMLDHCVSYHVTPHFKQGVELASHFDIPFYGWFMKQRGTIPVDREAPPKQALKQLTEGIRREVARGHSLLVFPEGTRTRDGRVGSFQTGLFRIAHKLELPIVPVAVTGMFEVMRKGAPYIHPGREVTVHVERPIETRGIPKSAIAELTHEVRRVIAARVDAYYENRTPPAGALSPSSERT